MNRVWCWEHNEPGSDEGLSAFEQCSYLAFGKRCKHAIKDLMKDLEASYLYLTRNKNEAAVVKHHHKGFRLITQKFEFALTNMIKAIS